jgi:hypothetical protein
MWRRLSSQAEDSPSATSQQQESSLPCPGTASFQTWLHQESSRHSTSISGTGGRPPSTPPCPSGPVPTTSTSWAAAIASSRTFERRVVVYFPIFFVSRPMGRNLHGDKPVVCSFYFTFQLYSYSWKNRFWIEMMDFFFCQPSDACKLQYNPCTYIRCSC